MWNVVCSVCGLTIEGPDRLLIEVPAALGVDAYMIVAHRRHRYVVVEIFSAGPYDPKAKTVFARQVAERSDAELRDLAQRYSRHQMEMGWE